MSADYFSKSRNIPIISQNTEDRTADSEKLVSTQPEVFQNATSNKPKGKMPEGYEEDEKKNIPEFIQLGGKPNPKQPDCEYYPTESPDLKGRENLWNNPNVPKEGWMCIGVTDLGKPVGVCQMCGHQIIRYVHHMIHPQYRPLDVGCICAGKMEGNIERAKQRENDFKNKEARRENFKNRKWKNSKNNNPFIKIKDHLIVLYYNKIYNNWKYSLDNVFCVEVYETKDAAMNAAFEALEKTISKHV